MIQAGLTVVLVWLAAASATGQESSQAAQADWAWYGGTSYAWRYSALNQITAENVHRLQPVWAFQTGDYADGLQATPIVIDGVMYLSTASSWVYALDAASGKVIWEYRYPNNRRPPHYGFQNRGVAVDSNHVFVGTYDNHLVALNRKTGREAWNVNVEDSTYCGCNITGAPLVVRGKVVAGVTGGDSAHRGYLTAFDVETGRLAWRFFTIPTPSEPGGDTWPGESWRFGGGAPWLTGSYDPELNVLYWGIGNPSSDFSAAHRKGANLYTGSMVALDPESGRLRWHYQEVPQDVWDFGAPYEAVLADLPVKGEARKLLINFGKGGFVWLLDRTTGKYLGSWRYVDHINWTSGLSEAGVPLDRVEPIEGKTVSVCPSPVGGRSWNHSAYSPRTGLIYAAAHEICADITAVDQVVLPGQSSFGGSFRMKAPPGDQVRAFVAAYDPVTGKRAWTHSTPHYLLASMLATGGDVVFTGTPQGEFFALNARTGAKLWAFSTGGGHRGGAVSYAVGGRQFVATPSGWGSMVGRVFASLWPNDPKPRAGSTLFVFALPEEKR